MMPQERVKKSAITGLAFDYQTLHGINLLCEWLSSPTRYQRVMFECTDSETAPQSLDDIVAERSDGHFDYWQVKYTPNPEDNLFTWKWLLDVSGTTARARSNLRKWFDALKKIDEAMLGDVQLVTNKKPDRDIETSLAGGSYIHLSKAPEDVQRQVETVLGSRENANWLFSRLRITHSDKGYLNLQNSIFNALLQFTDHDGIERLMNKARIWAFLEQDPSPDGWITLDIIRNIISQHRPRPIPENFTIPEGYEVPDEAFHSDFLAVVESGTQPTIVLTGPPGRGKSTYLSFVCEDLEMRGIPFVRHHYFLSLRDRDDRLSPYIVSESLIGQIARFHSKTGANTEGTDNLYGVLATCAAYYKAQQKLFVVVIDGLDHVWRENASDKQPLDNIFKQLIPVPDNLVLIVGTQPVADTQLPDRLVTHVPRQYWKELPVMSEISVMRYLQTQIACGRLFMQHDSRPEEELAESAHTMHQITGGHPLHVIYATEHLVHSGEGLSKWSVEHIPGDLSKDAQTYYASLWIKLTWAQKDILILLAEFSFYWPAESFSSSTLLPDSAGQTNLREIEHLLHGTAVGFQPFHESLIVFIKGSADYAARVQVLAPRVRQWLNDDAPACLKNTWLWVVQSRMGEADNLIQGLSRDWVMDRISRGYSLDAFVDILTEAEETAFDRRRYNEAYRLRHLKTRLLNGPEFQIPNATRLKICSWKCADDGAVLDEAFASRHQLPVIDLAGLGHALQWKRLDREAVECGKEALRRHRGDSRFAIGTYNSERMNDVLYLGKIFAELNTINVDSINPDSFFNAGDVRLVASFINGLTAKQDLVRIVTLWSSLLRPSRIKLAEDAAIRVAALSNVNIHSWREFKSFRCSTVAGCWSQLVNTPLDATPSYSFPANWQDYSKKESMEQMTHEWFFSSVLVALTTTAEFSWAPAISTHSAYFPEAVTYLNRMTQYAETVAGMWKRKTPVSFHQFYNLFADLDPPGKHESNKRYPHSEFCKTLIPIAVDCHLLGVALGATPLIDAASLEMAAQSSWFNVHHFREAYAQNGVRLLTDEAARFLFEHGKAYLSQWEETCEYSRALLELCEVALLHDMEEEARQLCRLCWDYVLGYGHRKDPTMLTLLDAIEYLVDDAPDFCRATLKEIAPQIHHITDYTDGKGTRQAQGYADELLVRLDRMSLAEKYAGHISSGDWHYADEALATFFSADISSVVFEAIARTGLPKEAIATLRDRAGQGEQRAFELLEIANVHSGASFGTMERSDSQDNSNETREFEEKPEEYPPENFDMLISAMNESKTYGLYSYLPKWYEYWAGQGQESALLQILEPRLLSENGSRDDCHYLLDQAFESALKLYGKPRAFKFVVQAQKEMGGWLDFYESVQKSKQRLQKIAQFFPERADEFIASSCFSKWRNRQQPNPRVIPDEKLVFFLVKLGRIQEAADLVRAMVKSVLEDTRNLSLTTPAWSNDSDETLPSTAELRVLIARITWPVPAVKWWAIQEMAMLLNSPLVESVEVELYHTLANARLETEVLELLYVFWIAKQSGYEPSIMLPTHINAASSASALVLIALVKPLLFEGRLRAPLILAPYTFKATSDFEEAQGTTVPQIFFTLLEKLERPQLPSFIKQYACEWENTVTLYPEAPFQRDIGYFYNHSLDEMTGQFVTRASHRGRSAYLRTLAVAQEIFDAPQWLIDDHVQVVLPLDPTLASLRSSKPNWLPDWDRDLPPEHADIEVFIRLAVQSLTVSEPGMTLLALSTPLFLSEKLIIDLELVKWVQWEERPIDAESLYVRHKQRHVDHGWCEAKTFMTTTQCSVIPIENILDIKTYSAPTAGEPGRWRRGYLHSDLDSRGVLLPLSTVEGVEIDIRPYEGNLELMSGIEKFGKWQYWNAGWNASHHQSVKSCCGIALTAKSKLLPQLWVKDPIKSFYHWKCTILTREESYSKCSLQKIYGVLFDESSVQLQEKTGRMDNE